MNNTEAHKANPNTDTEIAARINAALTERGINKVTFAQQVGLTYTTLRRSLEQHRGDSRSFTFRELAKIAEALQVQPSTLIPASFTEADAA